MAADRLAELAALENLLADAQATERARAQSLVTLQRAEDALAEIVADPGPTVAGGVVALDSDGVPVPDAQVRARAERALARVSARVMDMTA